MPALVSLPPPAQFIKRMSGNYITTVRILMELKTLGTCMDTEKTELPADTSASPVTGTATIPSPPMGRGFWAVMALISVLILLILYAQVQGITHPVAVNLTGSCWTLISYADTSGTIIPLPAGADANLTFSPAGRSTLGGYAGCNWYSYSYNQHNATSLQLTDRIATKRLCDSPAVMLAEADYLNDLDNTSKVQFRNGEIRFFDTSDRPLLVFRESGNEP